MPRLTLAALVILALAPLASSAGAATTAADSRAAFLKLLDRPRVALTPQVTSSTTHPNDLVEIAFTYASDANNRVSGILIKSNATRYGSFRAAVINLHGTGGNKDGQRKLLLELAHAGFVAVAIDGRYHGERAKGGKAAKSAEYVDAMLAAYRNPGREYPFFYDTAWDVMRLVDYLVARGDVDPKRIGLWGFSKGGIETYLTAAADPRIAAAVSCIGVQSFRWALDNNAWQSRISTIQKAFDTAAKESGVTAPDAAFARKFYDRVAPGIYGDFDAPAMLPLIAPRPFLAVNGATDIRTPLPGLEECAAAARTAYAAKNAADKFTLIVQPNTGHQVTPESMKQIHAWLAKHLKPETLHEPSRARPANSIAPAAP